jgi:putative RNA 2'-phosphotransferase
VIDEGVARRQDGRTALSKYLSYVLRHDPGSIGLLLGAGGWVRFDVLLSRSREAGRAFCRAELVEVVEVAGKRRFTVSDDGALIRASQGHSLPVDLELPAAQPPEFLYHGTVARSLPAIRAAGLRRMGRNHVHLSPDPETARIVGRRRGAPCVLRIAALAMHHAGHVFHRADNGVWLTEHVPPNFIADHS